MSDINWGERPTDKHCWLEAIGDVHSEESGWYILNGPIWRHIEHTGWNVAGEGEAFTVHRKPIEPYKPVVGEWCEYKNHNDEWLKCFYVGIDDLESNVFSTEGDIWSDPVLDDYRPINTERELFIEKAGRTPFCGKQYINNHYGDLYDNGARFTGPDNE